jgi:predicted Fe-Mo cluster-binding NifX family protein
MLYIEKRRKSMKLVIAITGASGTQLGKKFIDFLPSDIEAHIVISDHALTVESFECKEITLHNSDNISASISSGSFQVAVNEDAHHQHGQCQPLNAIGGKPINAVVAAGIGAGALFKLNSAGIKVYRAIDGTVNDNLMLLKSGKLPEITMDMTCAGHGRQGGCVH